MIRKTSPVIVHIPLFSSRWYWCVRFKEGAFSADKSYTTRSSALRAGRRAWAKIVTRMQQGDMP